MSVRGIPVGIVLVWVLGLGGALRVDAQTAMGCDQCHGELEFLRQHVGTLEEARALYAPVGIVELSAHGELGCAGCHDGYVRYPHAAPGTPETCQSCHEESAQDVAGGVHGPEADVQCASCHGTHDVSMIADLEGDAGVIISNQSCVRCHDESALVETDAHAVGVLCSDCHASHTTAPAFSVESTVTAAAQVATCGACHDTVTAIWHTDVHGEVAVAGDAPPLADSVEAPSCTSCHGAHGMPAAAAPDFGETLNAACAHCHEDYSETFLDSYHGKASSLGRGDVAQCSACHTAHAVYPTSDPRSSVSEERLLETCRSCHEDAAEGFVEFQPHADPFDPDGDPRIFWVNRFMILLLAGTFSVFGLHSVFWVGRFGVDLLKGRASSVEKEVT